jgi:NAD(P)-dependent dehydrogenase (short-subunit alcohol dehydrogenase family)
MSTSLFEGKVALVTGAGSGIGRASALAFAREGAKVMVSDVNAASCEETAAMIGQTGRQAAFMACNVASEQEVQALVARTVAEFGRLDCAFNNAGISNSRPDFDLDLFRRTIEINLYGVAYGVKFQLEQMVKQKSGAIVNTASIAGLSGQGMPDYVASKHGVVGITRSAALRYAALGIRVNAVCPGVIATGMTDPLMKDPEMKARIEAMTPMQRMGTADEIAEAVIWLCSDKASFVTGQALAVDGGCLCR